jgi:nucleoid DNA-binding protein
MNKIAYSTFVEKLAKRFDIPTYYAKKYLDFVFDEIKNEVLEKGNSIRTPIGSFFQRQVTGKKNKITKIAFRPGVKGKILS